MPRCFLLRLSRFLALSDSNDDEAIDDKASKDMNDNETAESDNETLRDLRARVLRRDFRFFLYSDRCLIHCLNHLFFKVYMQFRNSSCTRF